jgi:hypothetical protein
LDLGEGIEENFDRILDLSIKNKKVANVLSTD